MTVSGGSRSPASPIPISVETTIAGTIGARDGLADFLLGQRALLLLDNFEHLLGAAPFVSRLLAGAPEVKALVTSRAALHVVGEQEYPVLPLPDPDAAALFTERARSFDPGFEPDQHVTEICRRLDGLPLAIELAAARVRALPAARMVERLSSVLPLLTGGARDAPDRQRTLSATIEWSYDLLAEDEARLLDAVSVFAGSFSLEAAEDACDATLDSIESLIDKSLLRRTAEGRFFLLETVREFAADRLSRSGERDAVCRRHVDHLVRLAAEAERDRGATVDSWRRFASEQDNFREVMSWAQAVGDVGAQLELIGSTWPFWWYRGNAREGLRWVEAALGTSGDERSLRTVRVNAAGAMFAFRGGDTRALERYSAESLETARELGDPATMVWPLILRGLWAARIGDYGRSAELYEEAIAVAELVGNRQLIGIAKNNLGSNAMEQKDYAQAIELFEEAVAISRDLVATDELALEMLNVALCHHRLGRTAEALAKAREGFALAREAESLSTLGYGFTLLGALAYRQGRDPAAAATLLGVAQGLVRRLGEEDAEDPELDELFESTRSGLAHALGEERCAEAVATGEAMPLEEALAYALIVE